MIAKLFGCMSLVLVAIVYFLYGELRKNEEQIGQMEAAISVYESANKSNLKELSEMKENQKALEEQRVARERVISKLNEEWNKKIVEVHSEKEKDASLSDWYNAPVPEYIRLRNKNADKTGRSDRK